MPNSIVWFRQDLRLSDNPALLEAACEGRVIPLYILDTDVRNKWPLGGASKWWLHHSLESLQDRGVPLIVRQGKPLDILTEVLHQTQAEGIYWNRCYDPYSIQRDKEIKEKLPGVKTFNGSLLFEPWTIKTKTESYYKVFTPFWKVCLGSPTPRATQGQPTISYEKLSLPSLALEELNLLPTHPNWAAQFPKYWEPGEAGAEKALSSFLTDKISHYDKARDYPAQDGTSRLSPHLHFGEISPNQIWEAVLGFYDPGERNTQRFLSELGWREFCHYLLYHYPQFPEEPFQKKFGGLPWQENSELLETWQKGETGYPLVDAGMRELWSTGYMHNRVRMITASFLTKHCLIPWQAGEAWFWDTLVDADLANNSAGWQWVAGCGADAAPFFRIFNPVTQSKKFDPEGEYLRKWVPELAAFSNKGIHTPWLTSKESQQQANCLIGKDYPHPIVDLNSGRTRALQAYESVKS